MGWAEKQNKENKENQGTAQDKIYIVSPTVELQAEFNDFLKRTGAALETIKEFMDAIGDLDENDPKLSAKYLSITERLMEGMVLNYPSPAFVEADLATFAQVKVWNETLEERGRKL